MNAPRRSTFFSLLCPLLSLATALAAPVEVYTTSTTAGLPGAFGSANGTGSSARFSSPFGIAVDANGNTYVADTFNHTIRKLTNGQVTTFAGLAGLPGTADGSGSTARFRFPYGIAVDSTGMVFVADTENHTIRKITPAGVVSTYAGIPGVSGSNNGAAASARFNLPNALTVDATGNVYVADTYNHTIRKITPDGVVSTFAGIAGQQGHVNGAGTSAAFSYPFGLAADGAGNLYVADTYNYVIRRITPAAVVSTIAGSPSAVGSADGVGSAARFNLPRGMGADTAGNVYVADEANHTMRKITPDLMVKTIAGLAGTVGSTDGQGSAARFNRVAGVAVDTAGVLSAVDTYNHTIRSLVPSLVDVPPPLVDGLLDQSFNAGEFTNGDVHTAILQPDGKLIIGGLFNKVHGAARHGIARLNADGTLDPSFDIGQGANSNPNRVTQQPDGKIIIASGFSNVNGVARPAGIARLNTDGSLDEGFNPGRVISFDGVDDGNGNATSPGFVYSVVVEPNGKLIVVGHFFHIITGPGQAVPRAGVARFHSDGSFDPTFDPGAGLGGPPNSPPSGYSAVRQSSGKFVIQGLFNSYDNQPVTGLVRINNDGTFDPSFNAGTGPDNSSVAGLFNQADDRLIVFGTFATFNGSAVTGIVRLTTSGALDPSFNPPFFDEYGAPGSVSGVEQQPDGKLLVGGLFHTAGGATAHSVVRLAIDGTRDPSFDSSIGTGPSGQRVAAFAIRPGDGHIFLGGYFATYGGAPRNNMAWVAPDGSLDATFAGLGGATDYNPQIYSLAVQPDGKVLVAGLFTSIDGAPRYNLVRLNPDATIDPSFGPDVQTEGSLRAVVVQPDGKILIGGVLRGVNGVACGKIARLNPDGSLDTSFNVGSGANNTVQALAVDPAGNIFAGGSFTSFAGTARRGVVKLSPTGALDPNFNSGAGTSGTVFALGPGNDAAGILVGGTFLQYNGATARHLVRLNRTTGELDPIFNSGGSGPTTTVRAIVQHPGGKYYVGGNFSGYNGLNAPRIVRLNSDGTRDASFIPAANTPTIHALALQGDKLLAGGINVGTGSPAVRLSPNGEVDALFAISSGAGVTPANAYQNLRPTIWALAIQPDGKVLVGGAFNEFNGTPRVALARLTDPSLAVRAASRKTHGQAGAFELALPFVGNPPATENRSGGSGGNHEIVLTFAGPVSVGGVTVTSGSAAVTSVSSSGNTATISLAGVANAQTLALTISGLTSSSGATPAAVQLPIGFLLGDANGDRVVNSGDSIQTRSRAGQQTTLLNFRSDVNADGVINGGDTIVVRSRAGTSLP